MPNDTGQVGNQSIPRQAVAVRDVIYEASKHLPVAERAGIPVETVMQEEIEDQVTRGVPGEYDVAVDADTDQKRVDYEPIRTRLKWTRYEYTMVDSAQLRAPDPERVWQDNLQSASEFFAATMDYEALQGLKELVGTTNTVSANDTWDGTNADIEDDVTSALGKIQANANVTGNEDYSLVVPADVLFEARKLTLINNIQRTIQDYLSESFDVDFFGYRPPVNEEGNEYLDGLGSSCLLFVPGQETGSILQMEEGAANIPMTEEERIQGRGRHYTTRMAVGFLGRWDGYADYNGATDYNNFRVAEITGVA